MLSVITAARDNRQMTLNCLVSMEHTFRVLGMETLVEYILIDDESKPESGVVDLYREFRANGHRVTILRFRRREHYTMGFSCGLSLAQGNNVLFVSNDMVLPPAYIKTLLAVSTLDDKWGIVRGTSQYTDCFPEYTVIPPTELSGYFDVCGFSEYIAKHRGLRFSKDTFLTGDAVLVKRSVIERIGVMDVRFFGFFGDIDFGLRAQRAGFDLVCAQGAWLWHEGAGWTKDKAMGDEAKRKQIQEERMREVEAAYEVFVQKWDPAMPRKYATIFDIDTQRLRAKKDITCSEYVEPIRITNDFCELM